MHNFATIEFSLNNHASARDLFVKTLILWQRANDDEGEAATWLQIALIDGITGNHNDACEGLKKSLELNQGINNFAGEATTFLQIGFYAVELGRVTAGIKLIGLSVTMLKPINHNYTKTASQALVRISAQLKYTEKQLLEMLNQVSEAYQKDRGAGLVRAAFGEE